MSANEVYLRQYTLLDEVQMSGAHGVFAAIAALILWVIGVGLIFKRPSLRIRSAYLIACFLPCASGVLGFATAFMSAFASLGQSGVGDGFSFLAALGEITMPMFFGFIGSGGALIIAALVWMRRERAAIPNTATR